VQVSRIENYVGRTLADVQTEFSTLISGGDAPLLSIKEPVMFEESSKDAGTILEQTPAPGTGISGPAALSFVVSRGKDEGAVMPTLIGLDVDAALAEINNAGIQARFAVRDASARQTPGTVVSQNPAGGIIIAKNTPAEITVAAPAGGQLAEDEVFLLFTRDLPAHPFPVATTLEILNADGSRTQLAEMNHLGGQFTFPCRVKRGGALILSMLGSEVYRQPVD
jgi:beta-lactam-binding protein with PASTA domain